MSDSKLCKNEKKEYLNWEMNEMNEWTKNFIHI